MYFSKICTQSISRSSTASQKVHINLPQTERVLILQCRVENLGTENLLCYFQKCLLVAPKLCAAAVMLLLCSSQRRKYISMKMSWTSCSPVDMFFSWNKSLINGRELWMFAGRWRAMHLAGIFLILLEGAGLFCLTTEHLQEEERKDQLWIKCTSGVGLHLFRCNRGKF